MLGLVGAGGIGLELNAAITQLYWTQVSLILLVIIGAAIVSEWVSAKIVTRSSNLRLRPVALDQ